MHLQLITAIKMPLICVIQGCIETEAVQLAERIVQCAWSDGARVVSIASMFTPFITSACNS